MWPWPGLIVDKRFVGMLICLFANLMLLALKSLVCQITILSTIFTKLYFIILTSEVKPTDLKGKGLRFTKGYYLCRYMSVESGEYETVRETQLQPWAPDTCRDYGVTERIPDDGTRSDSKTNI